MKKRESLYVFLIILLTFSATLLYVRRCNASEKNAQQGEEMPPRLVEMAAEYPGVVVPQDEVVTMDLIFYNKGRSDETVHVALPSVPKGWEARVKTYKYTVTGIHIPSDDHKSVTFEAEPDEGIKPGKYEFLVKAQTPDGQFNMAETIVVRVEKRKQEKKESKGVKLTTSYPVLRGPSDAKFEFSVEVENKLDEDAVFDLFAQGPEGWDINFKPAYEDKYISSLALQANRSKTLAVVVDTPTLAQAGEYLINIRVSSTHAQSEADLQVVLTGTYELEAGTPSGLLSLDARQGKAANFSLYVKNTGSAVNHDIRFMSFKPENWKVEFNPEKIPAIDPGDLKQVEVTVTPYEGALVGDYSVGVDVQAERLSKNLEFRVTVEASTAWGWIGIGIIVGVIAGLTGLFRWLGRR